jgi:hypothetical protein
MTSSIPDSFSTSDLEAMLESAPKEDEIKQQHSDDCPGCPECEITDQKIEKAAEAGLELMVEQCDDPVVHKLALIKVAHNMAAWHTRVGENANDRGDTDCGTAWLRDAGKWQAIMDIAMSIGLGPNDSWCNHD